MYLRYGSHQHQSGEVTLSPITRQAQVNEAAQVYGFLERWKIDGFLQGTNAADLTAKIQDLEAAYSVQGANLGLFNDDNSLTAHGVFDFQTLGGVRVVSPPSYPVGEGAEYSTFRRYAIEIEFTRRNFAVGLLAWTESLNFSGGGPQKLFLETLTGPPQEQIVKLFTTFRAIQRGHAIGHNREPPFPPPIWPGALERAPEIEYVAPKRFGFSPEYAEYGQSWTYYFASATPLSGRPTVWPNL